VPAEHEAESETMSTESDLRVEVVDDEIIVSLPGWFYSVTYYKPERDPQLLAKDISDRDDPRAPMTVSQFLAKAWRLANDKASELGWIVRQSATDTLRLPKSQGLKNGLMRRPCSTDPNIVQSEGGQGAAPQQQYNPLT
jgi:hypothetical protein